PSSAPFRIIIGKLLLEICGQLSKVRGCGVESHTRHGSGYDLQIVTAAVVGTGSVDCHWSPEVFLCWIVEPCRQHPHNRNVRSVDTNGPTDDLGVRGESLFPQGVTKNCYLVVTGLIIFAGKGSAQYRVDSQDFEESGANVGVVYPDRLACTGKVGSVCLESGEFLERGDLLSQFEEPRLRDPVFRDPLLIELGPSAKEAIWLLERERTQQDRIDHAEDRRVGADAQSHDGNGDKRESWIFPKESEAVAKVAQ